MSHHRFNCSNPNIKHQEGAAFIVMLVILILGVATVLVGSLSSSALKIERNVKTMEALAQAKEALIGEAASDVDLASHHYPGSLPCPDTDDDGTADAGGGSECPQYIGRLPWKTLGLPDLRDASGERLWYTLSRNVRRYSAVRPLNSDVAGTLNVAGTYAENNVMAIVFAPGSSLGKSRSDSLTAYCSTTTTSILENRCAANYLEGTNAAPSPGAAPNVNYQSSSPGIEFNDQLITISHDQLFATVEKRVAREIKNILTTYYAAWGAYPFASAFTDPTAANFKGSAATYSGLFPINDQTPTNTPTWSAAPTISFDGAIVGGPMGCILSNNTGIGYSRWRCCRLGGLPLSCTGTDITIPNGVTMTITGYLNGIGLGLWRPHNINNVCEVRARDTDGDTVRVSTLFAPNSVSVTNALDTNGIATIVFRARGKIGGSTLQRIEFRDILSYKTDIKDNDDRDLCPLSPATAPVIPAWLFDDVTSGNNWHHVAYYSIAEKFAPGGDHTCTPTPCLTVNGQSGKHAAVTMTSDLALGQTRVALPAAICPATGTSIAPSACINNYLESGNATPTDYTYENNPYTNFFNDQVIVVSP